jgi:hypothetical protein
LRSAATLQTQARSSRRKARPQSGFAVLIASEGVLFDPEPAEMSRFLPAFAASFGGSIDGEVLAEVWRFVRLTSRSRGRDRYRCLDEALRLLERRAESAPQRGRLSSTAYALEAWLACELEPSPQSLAAATKGGRRPVLARVLSWSEAVDAALLEAPAATAYASACAALPLFAQSAELRLVPAPSPASRAPLRRLGVRFSCHGYPVREGPRVLVVGDTMAALEAARRSRLSFFPIVPGREEESWARLAETGFPRFLRGERAPSRGLLASFLSAFSSNPPWI